jgi:hypothetical protein
MGSRIDNTPGPQEDLSASETTNEKQLDRIAYDQDHGIFTK